MHDAQAIRAILQGGSGLLIMALGAFVLSVRPRTAATKAFAAFALGFGFNFLVFNIFWLGHLREPPFFFAARAVGWGIVGAGLAVMVWTFPRALEPRERRFLIPAGVVFVALAIGRYGAFLEAANDPILLAYRVLGTGYAAGIFSFLLVLALRLRASPDPEARRAFALAAAGPLVLEAHLPGRTLIDLARGELDAIGSVGLAIQIAVVLVLVSVFLSAARGPASHLGRNLALAALAAMFLGALTRGSEADLAHIVGPLRILMAAILTYAILRHRLLGIDVKVRWGLSKSAVAAAFVAAFFIASEGAQILFGSENEWVGLAAAGALVFVMAPLQRAAERLAEKAVPSAPHSASSSRAPLAAAVPATPGPSRDGGAASEREEAYKRALRLALRDRLLSREEEVHLHEVAEHMGIGAGRAMALRVEVEREIAAGDASS